MTLDRKTWGEVRRFVVVGIVAAAVHYAVYWLLMQRIEVNTAYTIGYVVSFVVNYYLSARYTFRRKKSVGNGLGFVGAHVCNYLLQMLLLNFFLWIGLGKTLSPIGVYAIAVPVNFVLVRTVFRKLG